ncbi:MAG: UbiA prenyltransferase family protein [Methanobacteriota archaeon]
MKIREYLKLARSFNAVLTGISPVMGAIAMQYYDITHLIILFFIGFFGHTYGFVLNDILDYKIDRYEKELKDRPLVSGTITLRNAKIFAFASLLISLLLAVYLSIVTQSYISFVVLLISACFVTMYDLISKKLPLTDIILAAGVFFLVLYGATATSTTIAQITLLAWVVCLLGAIQVLYMNIVAGGLKDIENDSQKGANTLAVKLGVRILNQTFKVTTSFYIVAYMIQFVDIFFVALPFFLIPAFISSPYLILQAVLLILISIAMLVFSYKLLSLPRFNRDLVRKYNGLHYYTNFALVPVMLMTLTPWALILIVFPALGFVLSNLTLHGTLLQPKTM